MGLATPIFAQINVVKETRADDANQKNIEFLFPEGKVSYQGKIDESGVIDKDSLLYGLTFQRPLQTNGGWSLWDFLKITVRAEDEALEVIDKCLLTNADILEDQQRVLVSFDWHLEKQGGGDLQVLLAWYPEQPDWVFVKVICKGAATLEQVNLAAFPGNTTGPEERERWFATEKQPPSQFSDETHEIDSEESGMVFFNRFAQENDGCLLVLGNFPRESIKINGSYAVTTSVRFAEGQTEATFALGGFKQSDPKEVIRVFQMEGARNMLNYLNSIDWSPKVDRKKHQSLINNIEELIKGTSNPSDVENFQKLKVAYALNEKNGNSSGLLDNVRELIGLKNSLIEAELMKFR